jgi:hypothetical protein
MLDGTINGSNLRIFQWPDNSGTYFWVTTGINAYTFGTVACGSPNWCSRLDPRYESVVITPAEYRAQGNAGFAGDQILEVAATAGPSGFSNGNNYVVYNYFKLNSLTYIGNAPNFMVKAIAEAGRVRMPSFFAYMLYSGAILLPVFAAVTWLFFKD